MVGMLRPQRRRGRYTMGANRFDDARESIEGCRALRVTPHVRQNTKGWRSAEEGRATRHPGCEVSQRTGKPVEENFDWKKTVGGLRKLQHRGLRLIDWSFTCMAAAYNLVRLRRLVATKT